MVKNPEDKRGVAVTVKLYTDPDKSPLLISGTQGKSDGLEQGAYMRRKVSDVMYRIITPVIERKDMFYFGMYLVPHSPEMTNW